MGENEKRRKQMQSPNLRTDKLGYIKKIYLFLYSLGVSYKKKQ